MEKCDIAQLHEAEQPLNTHRGGTSVGRLDRAYSSSKVADQLHRNTTCTALEWCDTWSLHRPVSFRRNDNTTKKKDNAGTIPMWISQSEEWARRVSEESEIYYQRKNRSR